jgi:hypothetical protein
MWGAHWSIELEKKGIPCAYIVDEPFREDVQTTCDKEGMSLLRRVYVPHPCGEVTDEQLPRILSEVMQSLTSPLTREEKSPPSDEMQTPPRTTCRGDLETVNQFFYEQGWTDGLPIIPPTEKKVRQMLDGTGHSSEEVVTENMLPEGLTVTVEKVAVVAAMAGCRPEYMPVLLSAVEAFSKEIFSSTVRSTSSFSFAILVNGPIVKEIGMNCGINALGSGTGNKANATIGRFLRLAIICLGGSRSGINDMSSQGNPSKYSFAFAENEERSPWEPFHMSTGFEARDSVLTIMSGGWTHQGPFWHTDLNRIAKSLTTCELPNGALVIMDPMSARKVSQQGYTKKQAEEFIWSHATKTMAEFMEDPFYPAFIEPVLKGKPWYGVKQLWPAHYLDLTPGAEVPVFPRGHVRIVVVGGETNRFTQVWQMARSTPVLVDKWR